jgi:hypothetical protein
VGTGSKRRPDAADPPAEVVDMPGTWTALAMQPVFNADVMLLLADGAVICHELDSNKWHKLTPDPSGSTAPEQAYIRGAGHR